MTSKTTTLTDQDGDTIEVRRSATPGSVLVRTEQDGVVSMVGGIPAADLITAIREVTGTPEPAPSTPPTAEDFAAARFAEVDGRPATRIDGAWAARRCEWWRWFSDLDMANLAVGLRARIIREAPTDPAALLDLAWEAACVVPEGVEIPGTVAVIEKWRDVTIQLYPKGYGYPVPASTGGVERRTLTPLPAPRPEGADRIEALLPEGTPDRAETADRIAREVRA